MPVPKRSILAQWTAPPAERARSSLSMPQWAGVAVLCLSGVAAFGLVPGTAPEAVPTREITRALALPPLPPPGAGEGERYWREERIQRGDTPTGTPISRASATPISADWPA